MYSKNIFLVGATVLFVLLLPAQQKRYETLTDIAYYTNAGNGANDYKKERCKLDIYYPKETMKNAVVVWFHGGGLSSGEKQIPDGLKQKGLVVVAPNYRLHPKVKAPDYLYDAAAAVAWVVKYIEKYNGDAQSIYVSGHSAGGYLASMVGLDKSYLEKHGINADSLAGLIPLSGHTITHFTIRKENGISGTSPIIDKFAPLYHVRADVPPMLLVTGDREFELLGRYEENAYFVRMMKLNGHRDIKLLELGGYGHNMVEPALPLLLNFIERRSAVKTKDGN